MSSGQSNRTETVKELEAIAQFVDCRAWAGNDVAGWVRELYHQGTVFRVTKSPKGFIATISFQPNEIKIEPCTTCDEAKKRAWYEYRGYVMEEILKHPLHPVADRNDP